MLKKALMSGVVVLGVASFLFGRDAVSYLKTCGNSVRNAVKSEVPLEFEVQRARELVEGLVPEIRHCMHVVAEQQVELEERREALAQRRASLQEQREGIALRRTQLQTPQVQYSIAGRRYSQSDLKRDLAMRFRRLTMLEETLEREEQIVAARERALAANQEKLNGLLTAKRDLEVQLEQLEARLNAVQAAETVSSLAIDDSQLTRAKGLIRELNKQLDVRESVLETQGRMSDLIPLADETTDADNVDDDILAKVDEYLGRNVADSARINSADTVEATASVAANDTE